MLTAVSKSGQVPRFFCAGGSHQSGTGSVRRSRGKTVANPLPLCLAEFKYPEDDTTPAQAFSVKMFRFARWAEKLAGSLSPAQSDVGTTTECVPLSRVRDAWIHTICLRCTHTVPWRGWGAFNL